MTKKRNNNKSVLILGLIALCGSGYFMTRNAITVLHGTLVNAEVLKVETVSTPGSGTSRTYLPTVRFKTKNGNTVTLSTGYSSTMFKFRRGDEVPVYYKTSNPSEFRIATFASMWAAPLVGLVLATLILIGAYKLYSKPDISEESGD